MVYPFAPMKDLHGTASAVVPAPLDRCRAVFEAVDRYPQWYPDAVREVDVLERDHSGRPTKARAKLHLVWGPVVKDFDLVLAVVSDPPGPIRLTRIAHAGSSQFAVTWGLRDDAGTGIDHAGTRIELNLTASMSVPRFLPVGGIGDAIADGFIAAATRALTSPAGSA
jgi:hypothetical protein